MAKRKQAEDPQVSDFGTPEARRQAFHIVEQPDPQDRATKRVRVDSGLIDWYLRRDYLAQLQADALRKWQTDAYLAGLLPACIGGYGQSIRGGVAEFSDLKIAAISRRTHAIAFLAGLAPHAVAIVDAVAVNEKPAGRWMMENLGGSPNEALNMLRRYAGALARFYGLTR